MSESFIAKCRRFGVEHYSPVALVDEIERLRGKSGMPDRIAEALEELLKAQRSTKKWRDTVLPILMDRPTIPLIIRRNNLKAVVGISPTTVDRLEAKGKFPARKHFSEGVVGWHSPEVIAWVMNIANEVQ